MCLGTWLSRPRATENSSPIAGSGHMAKVIFAGPICSFTCHSVYSYRTFDTIDRSQNVWWLILMNAIKKRQKFRPFAAAILSKHVAGSWRVQTVSTGQNPEFYELLKLWRFKTGCVTLSNTSLNVKGSPIVNSRADGDRLEELYGIKVFS